MEMGQDVMNVAIQLAEAVNTALDPNVSNEKRSEAYNFCEAFKESTLCVQGSLYLSSNNNTSHLVRHYGLQLMEHCVKYKWYETSIEDKILLKDTAMCMLQNVESQLAQHTHLKDALTKVIVEMIKREWPQQWDTLFPELFDISSKGCIQAELVLRIFLRVVEDVAVLQTLQSPQRRKDILQCLNLQVNNIFVFLLQLLESHYKSSIDWSEYKNEHSRIANLVIVTITEFIEWAPFNTILADDGHLLLVLLQLLLNQEFKLNACECLIQIVCKKGRSDEKQLLCSLFFKDGLILKLSEISLNLEIFNEYEYTFIKRISELLQNLSFLLSNVVKGDKIELTNFVNTDHLTVFFDYLLLNSNHKSMTIINNLNSSWNCLIKNFNIFSNSKFTIYLPKIVTTFAPKFLKYPYPNLKEGNNTLDIKNKFILIDFDYEESYLHFFYKYRVELQDTFRCLSTLIPVYIFEYIEKWLISMLQKVSIPFTAIDYITWETLSVLYDVVLSKINDCSNLENGLRLLSLCLECNIADPVIHSYLLSCISALLSIVNKTRCQNTSALYMQQVLNKIFNILIYEYEGETKYTRSKNVKALRYHAVSFLIKASVNYTHLLLPTFDTIKALVFELKRNQDQLAKSEQVLLSESMIIISNKYQDYYKQSELIKEFTLEINDYWRQFGQSVLNNHLEFMNFLGLTKEPSIERNECSKNRAELVYCLDIISAIVKRCKYEKSDSIMMNGGDGGVISKNPCTDHVLPLLPNVFLIIKMIHGMWGSKDKLAPTFQNVFELSENEKKILLGGYLGDRNDDNDMACDTTSSGNGVPPFNKMQGYLSSLYENSMLILSKSCQTINEPLYNLPNFTQSFIASIFSDLNNVPDYRLRVMIRNFLKSFISLCPGDKQNLIIVPIFSYFAPFILERLTQKWQYVSQYRNEENFDNKELLEDRVLVQLTREYTDLIRFCLFSSSSSTTPNQDQSKQVFSSSSSTTSNQDQLSRNNSPINETDDKIPNSTSSGNTDTISQLGTNLLRNEITCLNIVTYLLRVLSWNDSCNSLKVSSMIIPITRQLLSDNTMTSEMSIYIVTALLQALQVHGQHDSNQGILLNVTVQAYDVLRPYYASIYELMKTVPGINMDDLMKFDDRAQKLPTIMTTEKIKVEKGRKEMFKKLINQIIGKDVGQIFKRKERIRDLPRIIKQINEKDEFADNDFGISNFFK